jgi:AcrR family transcriptional regulator
MPTTFVQETEIDLADPDVHPTCAWAKHTIRVLNVRSVRDLTARARIRDAALARFAADGFERATVRAIAADAGVSPALVLFHFCSKDELRAACDDYVATTIMESIEPWLQRPDVGDQPASIAELFAGFNDLVGYVGRAVVEGGSRTDELIDRLVDITETMLGNAEKQGIVRPTTDPRTRAACLVLWDLVTIVLGDHMARALGETDQRDVLLRYGRFSLDIYTNGILQPTDSRRTS